MRLRFVYVPVPDLAEAIGFYRRVLGAEIAWQEGPSTCGLQVPGDPIQVLLDADPGELGAGPMYVVPDVRATLEGLDPEVRPVRGPERIGPGWFAILEDPAGTPIRLIDDTESRERRD